MVGRTALELVQGDITLQDVDAIVNAANCGLSGGGGVDGAIHRAGGPRILDECRRIGRISTGEAVITSGGNLKARHVIHAVGPSYDGRVDDPALLASAYSHALSRAVENGLRSIAFPSISTGAYRFPLNNAAVIAIRTVVDFIGRHPQALDVIRFVLFDAKTFRAYASALSAMNQP
jgi:O-acetyl-ADP-ribose deacetylase (regulator of RNase III)